MCKFFRANGFRSRLSVVLLAATVGLCDNLVCAQPKSQPRKEAVAEMLTKKEEIAFRKVVYTESLCACMLPAGPFGAQRAVDVPIKIMDQYKRKRVGTLRLLLDIVKGGRPADALKAATYAIALEEGPVVAMPIADTPEEILDEFQGNLNETLRDGLIENTTNLLSNAERQLKLGKKKGGGQGG